MVGPVHYYLRSGGLQQGGHHHDHDVHYYNNGNGHRLRLDPAEGFVSQQPWATTTSSEFVDRVAAATGVAITNANTIIRTNEHPSERATRSADGTTTTTTGRRRAVKRNDDEQRTKTSASSSYYSSYGYYNDNHQQLFHGDVEDNDNLQRFHSHPKQDGDDNKNKMHDPYLPVPPADAVESSPLLLHRPYTSYYYEDEGEEEQQHKQQQQQHSSLLRPPSPPPPPSPLPPPVPVPVPLAVMYDDEDYPRGYNPLDLFHPIPNNPSSSMTTTTTTFNNKQTIMSTNNNNNSINNKINNKVNNNNMNNMNNNMDLPSQFSGVWKYHPDSTDTTTGFPSSYGPPVDGDVQQVLSSKAFVICWLVVLLLCILATPTVTPDRWNSSTGNTEEDRQRRRRRRRRLLALKIKRDPKLRRKVVESFLESQYIVHVDTAVDGTTTTLTLGQDQPSPSTVSDPTAQDNNNAAMFDTMYNFCDDEDDDCTCVICLEPFRKGDRVAWRKWKEQKRKKKKKKKKGKKKQQKQAGDSSNSNSKCNTAAKAASINDNAVTMMQQPNHSMVGPEQQQIFENNSNQPPHKEETKHKHRRDDDFHYYAPPECMHVFHYDCILPWLMSNHIDCPSCRTIILRVDELEAKIFGDNHHNATITAATSGDSGPSGNAIDDDRRRVGSNDDSDADNDNRQNDYSENRNSGNQADDGDSDGGGEEVEDEESELRNVMRENNSDDEYDYDTYLDDVDRDDSLLLGNNLDIENLIDQHNNVGHDDDSTDSGIVVDTGEHDFSGTSTNLHGTQHRQQQAQQSAQVGRPIGTTADYSSEGSYSSSSSSSSSSTASANRMFRIVNGLVSRVRTKRSSSDVASWGMNPSPCAVKREELFAILNGEDNNIVHDDIIGSTASSLEIPHQSTLSNIISGGGVPLSHTRSFADIEPAPSSVRRRRRSLTASAVASAEASTAAAIVTPGSSSRNTPLRTSLRQSTRLQRHLSSGDLNNQAAATELGSSGGSGNTTGGTTLFSRSPLYDSWQSPFRRALSSTYYFAGFYDRSERATSHVDSDREDDDDVDEEEGIFMNSAVRLNDPLLPLPGPSPGAVARQRSRRSLSFSGSNHGNGRMVV